MNTTLRIKPTLVARATRLAVASAAQAAPKTTLRLST